MLRNNCRLGDSLHLIIESLYNRMSDELLHPPSVRPVQHLTRVECLWTARQLHHMKATQRYVLSLIPFPMQS